MRPTDYQSAALSFHQRFLCGWCWGWINTIHNSDERGDCGVEGVELIVGHAVALGGDTGGEGVDGVREGLDVLRKCVDGGHESSILTREKVGEHLTKHQVEAFFQIMEIIGEAHRDKDTSERRG